MTSAPDVTWIAHPDVITAAIKTLAGAVVVLGASLSGVIVYVWQSHKAEWQNATAKIENQVTKIGDNLEKIANELYDRTNDLEHRITAVESVCADRHKVREIK